MAIPPDYNNPILVTRPGGSKRLVGVHLGKNLDWQSPFSLILVIVLAALFFAGAALVTTELWYLGVTSLVAMTCLFFLIPVLQTKQSQR